jgi:hypothetical protein
VENTFQRTGEKVGVGPLLVVLAIIEKPGDPQSQGSRPCELALGDGRFAIRAIVDPAHGNGFLDSIPGPGFVLDIGEPGTGHLVQRTSAGIVLDGPAVAPDPSLLEIRALLRDVSVVGFADMVQLEHPHTAGPDIAAPTRAQLTTFSAPAGSRPFDTVQCSGQHCWSMSGRCTMSDLGAGDAESGFAEDWRSGLTLWRRRRGQRAVDANICVDPTQASSRQKRFFLYYYLANTVFGFRSRRPMPSCATAAVRAAHPNPLGLPYVVEDMNDEDEGEGDDEGPGPPPYESSYQSSESESDDSASSQQSDDSASSQHTYDSTPADDDDHMRAVLANASLD